MGCDPVLEGFAFQKRIMRAAGEILLWEFSRTLLSTTHLYAASLDLHGKQACETLGINLLLPREDL